jgi:acetyl-CoA C-acetyltransferase
VLAQLKPAFRTDGTITAGNAPGLNDAAAAMVLADETWAEQRGLQPQARLVTYGIAAVEPGMFGLGPIPAVRQALQRAGWDARSIERVEINEAFAAIAIVVARELGLPEDIVFEQRRSGQKVTKSCAWRRRRPKSKVAGCIYHEALHG